MELILGLIIGSGITFILSSLWIIKVYKEGIVLGEISKDLDILYKNNEEYLKIHK